MNNKTLYIIIILIINLIIESCVTISNYNLSDSSENYLYKTAKKKLLHHNYTNAIQDLLNLEKLNLFEPWKQQIHLDLIYAYYKSNDLVSANNFIQNFFKLYPNHKYLDYVLYMHGIVNMNLDTHNSIPFIQNFYNTYQADHDPIYANAAFCSLLKLIQHYPNSQYYTDSYKRLIILKNRLAEHELSIIKFYYKKNAYKTVITRTEKILHYFSDTQAALQALYYMKKIYQNIHQPEQADKINQIISKNTITY